MTVAINRAIIDALGAFSTPTILNGLKRLGVTPSQFEVMGRKSVGCMAPDLGVRCGFAVTRKVATRRDGGPGKMIECGPDQGLLAVDGPRFLVVENVGDWQGPVCIWGEVTSHINTALDCRGGVTNGPVRDLAEMEHLGFQSFAGGADVGGGFVDLLEINTPVMVGGIHVAPRDLIHADRHGVIKIPLEHVAGLPAAIARHAAWEETIFAVCTADTLDLEALQRALNAPG